VAEIDRGVLREGWEKFVPPVVVELGESGNDIRVLCGDIGFLAGVLFNVVEFLAVIESPLAGHDGAITPFDRVFDALGVGYQNSVWPVFGGVLEQGSDAAAIELDALGCSDGAEVHQGGDDIDVRGDGLHVASSSEFSLWPVSEKGDAVAAVVLAAFLAAHARVEDLGACGGAVVSGEDEDGIVGEPFMVEKGAHFADVVIDIGDHAVEVGAGE